MINFGGSELPLDTFNIPFIPSFFISGRDNALHLTPGFFAISFALFARNVGVASLPAIFTISRAKQTASATISVSLITDLILFRTSFFWTTRE